MEKEEESSTVKRQHAGEAQSRPGVTCTDGWVPGHSYRHPDPKTGSGFGRKEDTAYVELFWNISRVLKIDHGLPDGLLIVDEVKDILHLLSRLEHRGVHHYGFTAFGKYMAPSYFNGSKSLPKEKK